jgi:hypothetical protein
LTLSQSGKRVPAARAHLLEMLFDRNVSFNTPEMETWIVP